MRFRRGSGSARQVASSSATGYFFETGMMRRRTSWSIAVSDTARFTWVSASRRCISGSRPTVETVMRRCEKSTPHVAVSVSMAPTVPA